MRILSLQKWRIFILGVSFFILSCSKAQSIQSLGLNKKTVETTPEPGPSNSTPLPLTLDVIQPADSKSNLAALNLVPSGAFLSKQLKFSCVKGCPTSISINQSSGQVTWPVDLSLSGQKSQTVFAVTDGVNTATSTINLQMNVTINSPELPLCTQDGQINCRSNNEFRSVDMKLLTPANIRTGISIAGQVGNFPSLIYPLPGSTGIDLPSLAANVPAGTYDWWKKDGTKASGSILDAGTVTPSGAAQSFVGGVYRQFTVSGDANLSANKILSPFSIFGVVGSGISAFIPTPSGALVTTVIRASCAAHLAAGNSVSGRYLVAPSGVGGRVPMMEAACDMTTDGGGWTLVLNYLHKGGTDPEIAPLAFQLPLLSGNTFGADDSATAAWGHLTPELLGKFSFTEARFYCSTPDQSRLMHFKTQNIECINYLKTGNGSCFNAHATLVDRVDAVNSAVQTDSSKIRSGNDGGSNALSYRTFSEDTDFVGWGVRGGAFGDHYLCNSARGTSSDSRHQAWVR